MFEYSPEALEMLEEQVSNLDTMVIDNKVMVPAEIVDSIAYICNLNLAAHIKSGQVCDLEELHTVFFIDWLTKLSTTIAIKHSDEMMPDDISSLDERDDNE